ERSDPRRRSLALDVLTPAQRRRNMCQIRARDTGPERALRSLLHRAGFRFRVQCSSLPGRPDLVLPKYRTLIYVHGCFWHAHSCRYFKWPRTRSEFWRQKIVGNKRRDKRNTTQAMRDGWRVLIVWECALRGKERSSSMQVLKECADFLLRSPAQTKE